MLFIGRTMNKEKQLGREEKGKEKKKKKKKRKKKKKVQSTELRILLVESHGRHRIDSPVNVRVFLSFFPLFFPPLAVRSLPHPVLQEKKEK